MGYRLQEHLDHLEELEKEIDLMEEKYYGFESLSRSDVIELIKHFFKFGLKTQKGEIDKENREITMTQEEKAKAYDEAYKRVVVRFCSNVANEIFPELKESGDEKIRNVLVDYFKRYKEQEECGIKTFYGIPTDNIIAWLERQGEHKSIWHNEDEEPQRGSLILLIMQSGNPIVAKIIEPNHTFNHGERWAYIDDLLEKQGEQKSIDYNKELKKCRENPLYFFDKYVKLKEQKHVWSEEDERMIANIIDYMKPMPIFFEGTKGKSGKEYTREFVKKAINWLKSLKPQNSWKPSDEQMKALADALSLAKNCGEESAFDLRTLYEQLKKLREE